MAYVSLEDDTGAMELLVFARALDESGGYIRENQADPGQRAGSPSGTRRSPS